MTSNEVLLSVSPIFPLKHPKSLTNRDSNVILDRSRGAANLADKRKAKNSIGRRVVGRLGNSGISQRLGGHRETT